MNIDWTMSLKIKIHFISRINFPHNILPSLVLSNALALKLRHGHGHAGHGGPFFFFERACPQSPSGTMSYVDLHGRLPSRQSVHGPFSRLQRRAPSCDRERDGVTATVAAAKARQPCILYSIRNASGSFGVEILLDIEGLV